MKFENLKTEIRNITDEDMNRWNASSYKGKEYIITIYLQRSISEMLSSKIGTDTPFYKRTPTRWEAEYIDKYDDGLEDIEEIMIDDFIEAIESDFCGWDYEITVFRERFEDVLDKYQGGFEEKLRKYLEEYSNLKEVITMSKADAEKLCRDIYLDGWRDFKVTNNDDTVSLEMAINIFGDEFDLDNPFDLLFHDEQGFEHDRVPNMYSKDHEKVEEYESLVKETLEDLDQIIQYVYDERYSDETHNIKIGRYNLIIPPYSDY